MANYNGLELDSIQAFKTASIDIIERYCIENNIQSDNIHPLQWDDIIQELNIILFEPNKKWYKVDGNYNNEYNAVKLYNIFIYVFRSIHNKYKQTMTLLNYYTMLGISKQVVYNIGIDRLSSCGIDSNKNNLAEIIAEYCENSYIKALEGTTQHMKYLPTLNKRYGYNMPGTNNTNKQAAVLVQRENVMQIDEKNSLQLPDVDK